MARSCCSAKIQPLTNRYRNIGVPKGRVAEPGAKPRGSSIEEVRTNERERFLSRLFQRGRTEYKEYGEAGGWREQRVGSRMGREEETGSETTGESREETGCSSPDSRYLITDIASPLAPPPPLFLPHPEQMFAPRCRGQIAARSNGRLVLQGTASCLPSDTRCTHTHTHTRARARTCIHNKDIALIACDFMWISKEALSGNRLFSVRKFAFVREHFLRQCRLQGRCAFVTPGETYRTSGVLTSSSCVSELMGLINVSPYSLHPSTLLYYFNG